MEPSQDLFDVTSDVLLGLRPILNKEQPDVFVHGDTTTTMAASLAAYYCQKKLIAKLPVA